jgi:hypothetical protein
LFGATLAGWGPTNSAGRQPGKGKRKEKKKLKESGGCIMFAF